MPLFICCILKFPFRLVQLPSLKDQKHLDLTIAKCRKIGGSVSPSDPDSASHSLLQRLKGTRRSLLLGMHLHPSDSATARERIRKLESTRSHYCQLEYLLLEWQALPDDIHVYISVFMWFCPLGQCNGPVLSFLPLIQKRHKALLSVQ